MSSKSGKSSSLSASSASSSADKPGPKTKIDPSFKSKRYRDKLRTEVKALEGLLPVDRTSLSRKLDSQTVFRLVLALLRIKGYFQASELQSDPFPVVGCPYDVTTGENGGSDDVSSLVQGLACLQVLDGFLLVLTADGTILYVSDNVLQYLGYNQVDLMHRCLYSLVHRDDMVNLKTVLETPLVTRYEQPGVQQERRHPMEQCGAPGGTSLDACASLSFICRMRCFSGSSVGYLKMHCSGKMVHRPGLPKSKRSSGSVALLFCNPFMLRAAELTPDMQSNVFWSKHDLDLLVKEMDAKATDVVGFKPEEMEKESFYSLVHPEDLTALASCHKLLIDSGEVQTVYFRLQTKGGDWVWLTSRGKVISKNSKKFSIAFSHCPLREEDSIYIQQEAILRRRFAIMDLMYLSQFRQEETQRKEPHPPQDHPPTSSAHGNQETPLHPLPPSKPGKAATVDGARYDPVNPAVASSVATKGCGGGKGEGRKEEVGVVDTSCVLEVTCPSSWHAMSDRHSPVLPSSHVAHKISQREKQLQFQEFCKRQQMGTNGSAPNGQQTKFTNSWEEAPPYPATPVQELATSTAAGQGTLPSARGVGGGCGTGIPDPHGFDPSGASFAGFGSCVQYNAAATSVHPGNSAPASFVHHWYNGGSVSMGNHPPPADCLTPTRSPHQCGAGNGMVGPVPNTVTNQFHAYHPPHPAYASAPVPQNVSAYSSMPPSPPPSPPSIRPFLPHHQVVETEPGPSTVQQQQQYYRPGLQSWQHLSPSVPQRPCQYRRNDVITASSGHSMSTITDLQKTTEKFLQPPLKKERQGESDEVLPELRRDIQTQAPYTGNSYQNPADRWSRAAWTFNGQLDISWRPSAACQSFGQVNVNGSVDLQPSVANCSEPPPYSYAHHGFQNSPLVPHPMFPASVPQPAPQQYPYSTFYPHLGSPPAYPYGVYPQLGYQGGQYPVNSFYAATPCGPVKVPADFPRPAVECPVDLPSIGSFLELLHEV